LGYSLILPSSWFGVLRKNMVQSWWYLMVKNQLHDSKRTIVPEQSGVVKEEMSSLFTTRGERPPGTGLRTKPMGWVLQGQLR
jgi:hypothetical protein